MKRIFVVRCLARRPGNLYVLVVGLMLSAWCGFGSAAPGEIIAPDRRIDWSPGIPGGIPSYPVGVNIKDAPYNAKGDGVADDAAAIQKAINDCPTGKAVFLPEGNYRVGAPLDILGKSIVLRGEGPTKTRLLCDSPSGSVIHIYNTGVSKTWPVLSGYEKDSKILTLADTDGFKAGAQVFISEDNDPALCEQMPPWRKRFGQIALVASVEGKNVTLNRPLYITYKATLQVKLGVFPGCFKAGVEDLYIERTNEIGMHDQKDGVEYDNINIEHVANCWVKNVESYKTAKFHVHFEQCCGCEVRDSYIHLAWGSGGGGQNYGVYCGQTSDNLIENNVFERCRHSMLLEGGSCGNVYGYNYSRFPINEGNDQTSFLMSDIAFHGGFPYMNLFEGNIATDIRMDNVWGTSQWNTCFRNDLTRRALPAVKFAVWAVDVQKNNLYENFVGNVLGRLPEWANPADAWRIGYDQNTKIVDPRVAATILRHGNFDETTGKVEWDEKISEHKLPDSLYLKAKPAFFGDHPWPAIGPDVEPHVGFLPAKDRYDRELCKEPTEAPKEVPKEQPKGQP